MAKAEESTFDIESISRFPAEAPADPTDWKAVRRRLYVWIAITAGWLVLIWIPLYFLIRPQGSTANNVFSFLNMVGIGLVELAVRFRFKEWYK